MKNIKKIIIAVSLLVLPFNAYAQISPFLPVQGGTGTGCKPTLGQVLVGTSGGIYACQATSTLGITGGSGTNYFTNSGSNTYLTTGTQLGIGTSNPVDKLSVAGNVDIGNALAGLPAAPVNGLIVQGLAEFGNPGVLSLANQANVSSSTSAILLRLQKQSGDSATAPTSLLNADYLQVGGQEYNVGGLYGIGLGYLNNPGVEYPPVMIAAKTLTVSGNTVENLGFFLRSTGSGGATPTEDFTIASNGNVGVGSTTPNALLSIGTTNGISLTTATSTFNSTGGINLTNGCYAFNGACITGGGGGSGVTSINASGGSTGMSFSGGPVTTSGTLTLAGVLNIANGGTASTTNIDAARNVGVFSAYDSGGGTGQDFLVTVPKYNGQVVTSSNRGVGQAYLGVANGTTAGSLTNQIYFPYGFGGSGEIPTGINAQVSYAPAGQIPFYMDSTIGNTAGVSAIGDAGVYAANFSSQPNQSGTSIGDYVLDTDSVGNMQVVYSTGATFTCVGSNRNSGLAPGNCYNVFNRDSLSNKGYAVSAPAICQLSGDTGNDPIFYADLLNDSFRSAKCTLGVYQPTDQGVVQSVSLVSGGSGYSVGDTLRLIENSTTTASVYVNSVSGGVITGFTLGDSGNGFGRGYIASSSVSTITGGVQDINSQTITQVTSKGSGYTKGDEVTVVQSGASGGKYWVGYVDSNGGILNLNPEINYEKGLNNIGTGYHTATGLSLSGGTGSGAVVSINGDSTTGTGTGAKFSVDSVAGWSDDFSINNKTGNTFIATSTITNLTVTNCTGCSSLPSGTQGQFLSYLTNGNTVTPTSTISTTFLGNIDIGTTGLYSSLKDFGALNVYRNLPGSYTGQPLMQIAKSQGDLSITATNSTSSEYLALGQQEFGVGTQRLIGFGYNSNIQAGSAYPAYFGFTEQSSSGATKGDFTWRLRSDTASDHEVPVVMSLTSQGNLGIGTTTPGTLLSVQGTGTNGINLDPNGTSTLSAVGGINLIKGCYAVAGTCITGGSGSGTVNSGTQGQVAYYANNGTAVSGTSTIYISSLLPGFVGIGTTSPQAVLDVVPPSSGFVDQELEYYGNDNVAPNLLSIKGRGTNLSPTGVQSGDNLGFWGTNAYMSNGKLSNTTSDIFMKATENYSTTNQGTSMSFQVTKNTTASKFTAMTIDQSGNIGIGTTSPYAPLSVVGTGGVVAENFNATSTTATSTFAGDITVGSGTPTFTIDYSGHMMTGGNSPTCGTSCSSVIGDDNTFIMTTGVSVSSATVNFASTWRNGTGTAISPVCIPTEGNGGTVAIDATTTPTTVTVSFLSALSTKNILIMCRGSLNATF